MKELILTLMDHKGLVRALIGLAIFFVIASAGVFAVRTFGTTSPHEETKKEKKSDDIKLSKEDKETIDDYTNDTKQLVALLQSNSWIATNGEKSIDFGDNTITVIDPGSSKSNSKPKSFVIQSMTQETEDGTGNEIYNCSIEINGKSHLLMVTKPKSSSDITVAINLSDTGLNQFVRVQSASDLKVTGFDTNMEEALGGDAVDTIKDFVSDKCSTLYPLAATAECTNKCTVDYNKNTELIEFKLSKKDGSSMGSLKITYNLGMGSCSLPNDSAN